MYMEIDSDGLLDTCRRCGSPAVFWWRGRKDGAGALLTNPVAEWKASCSSCAEETGWYDSKYPAGHDWNRQQRKRK